MGTASAGDMVTAGQLRAARALLSIDQRTLAELAGVSVQTIQRMEASENVIRGIVYSLTKVVEALHEAGIELISEDAPSFARGRGVRLRSAEIPRFKDSRVPIDAARTPRSRPAAAKGKAKDA